MIKERLENIDALKGKFQLLSNNEVIKNFEILKDFFKNNRAKCDDKKDFSDSTNDEIINWFRGLKVNERFINIYWHSSNEGICLKLETFVVNFDEIWYPSSDDIWVTGDDKSWLIQIDHEEIFSFFTLDETRHN